MSARTRTQAVYVISVAAEMTPWATWVRRMPVCSMMPQPVWRRPGSMPRMRIEAVMAATLAGGRVKDSLKFHSLFAA